MSCLIHSDHRAPRGEPIAPDEALAACPGSLYLGEQPRRPVHRGVPPAPGAVDAAEEEIEHGETIVLRLVTNALRIQCGIDDTEGPAR